MLQKVARINTLVRSVTILRHERVVMANIY